MPLDFKGVQYDVWNVDIGRIGHMLFQLVEASTDEAHGIAVSISFEPDFGLGQVIEDGLR